LELKELLTLVESHGQELHP
jgi:hypothetical protein